ncbi:MAG TPA: hypothetical protein VHI51_06540 [Ktedonobacterales bacterium]|jgi:hypothetical protein|nr:hypothetical protein [Ktedonobacterales bacterium]
MQRSEVELEALMRDVILRALASLRERNALPSVDLPPVTLLPLAVGRGYRTRVAIEIASAADAAEIEHRPVEALASSIASYLAETVDLVPAYHVIARVETAGDGKITLYLREA